MSKMEYKDGSVIWLVKFKNKKIGFIKYRLGNLGYGIGRSLFSAINDYNFNPNVLKLNSAPSTSDLFNILGLRIRAQP